MVFVDYRRHALLMLSYAGSWDATATATKDDCTKVNKVSNDIELKDSKRERTGDNPAWAVDGFGDVPICRHHGSSVQNRSDRLGGPMKSFVLPVNLDAFAILRPGERCAGSASPLLYEGRSQFGRSRSCRPFRRQILRTVPPPDSAHRSPDGARAMKADRR